MSAQQSKQNSDKILLAGDINANESNVDMKQFELFNLENLIKENMCLKSVSTNFSQIIVISLLARL